MIKEPWLYDLPDVPANQCHGARPKSTTKPAPNRDSPGVWTHSERMQDEVVIGIRYSWAGKTKHVSCTSGVLESASSGMRRIRVPPKERSKQGVGWDASLLANRRQVVITHKEAHACSKS